jgi:hypothetical protein
MTMTGSPVSEPYSSQYIRCSENPGAAIWPDRMKGGFEGWLFGAAVWVLASTEIISATNGR